MASQESLSQYNFAVQMTATATKLAVITTTENSHDCENNQDYGIATLWSRLR